MKVNCRPFAFTQCKAFLKSKYMSETGHPVSFSTWFLNKKCLSAYTLLTKQSSLSGCLYFEEY